MMWQSFAFGSALLAALAAILEKGLLQKISVMGMTLIMTIFSLIFVWPLLATAPTSIMTLPSSLWAMISIKSCLEAVQFGMVMWSIQRIGLSTTLPVMAMSPGLVAVAAWLLLSDALSPSQMGGLALMVMGTYIIFIAKKMTWWKPIATLFHKDQWPLLVGLSVSVAAALVDKTILSGYKLNPQVFIGAQQIILAGLYLLVFCVLLLLKKEKVHFRLSRSVWMWLLVLAAVTVGYRFFQMKAVSMAPVALVLAIRRLSVVMATLVGGSWFKEEGFVRKSVAGSFIVAGAIIIGV